MLFHSLSGPEVHGVIDEMDRRAKSEAPAISSAIDRGDTETFGESPSGSPGLSAGDLPAGSRPIAPSSGNPSAREEEEGNKVETEITTPRVEESVSPKWKRGAILSPGGSLLTSPWGSGRQSRFSSTLGFRSPAAASPREKGEPAGSPGAPAGTMPSISSDRAALCAGCGGKISDRYYLLAVDKQWHMRCLKCCECKLNLESELTCFSKDGSIYCKEDYYRRFSVQRCARCHLGISASEMVMRARDLVYHLNCFTCTTCNKMLTTGDHFGMKDSLVYCRLHFEALLQGEYPAHFNHALCRRGGRGSARALARGRIWQPTMLARSLAFSGSFLLVPRACWALSCNENDAEHLDRDQPYPSSQKTKRMRTSFKHHQLRTMKSYFAINHNPDAKDLKQLAQKTGLTKRVLQVWFQNARAKFRRNLLRQENTGVDKATDAALQTGTPSGPASELSNASLSPSSTPTTLTDLTSPTLPTVTSVLTSVPGNLESHEPHSPSQTTLTNLF
ncbi:LIM/homeobox protein Lhx2 [Heterocephalus glaber]|uniref:LIM/homeobox protein Lhx2 n=1 Tax=Heterocephalus glaber TaxID=10181 RepID=G5B6W9_HETGA|nr:LIM/homeobox protein Lhx2 [Heterocephalus glaber]